MNSTNNKRNTNVSKKNSGGLLKKILLVIIILGIISFIIYLIVIAVRTAQNQYNNNPVIVNDVIDAFVARPSFQLPQVTQGMGQSFSTWIYVKDWNYKFGQYKNILWKGNPSNSSTSPDGMPVGSVHCPSLWLYPLTNSLKVITSTSVPEGVESCDIQNIPLMTWVHVVYILNNRTTEIYINGKLERSCALKGVPTITNDPVYITAGSPQPGYYGKIGRTQYFNHALMPNDVASLYQKGPLGSANYNINFFQNGRFIYISSSGIGNS